MQQVQQDLIAAQGKLQIASAEADQDKQTAADKKSEEGKAQDGTLLM